MPDNGWMARTAVRCTRRVQFYIILARPCFLRAWNPVVAGILQSFDDAMTLRAYVTYTLYGLEILTGTWPVSALRIRLGLKQSTSRKTEYHDAGKMAVGAFL
jgi:hypothetical protein